MRNLDRNKRPIYVCKMILNNGIRTYEEPIKMWENYRTANTTNDLKAFGEDAYSIIRISTSPTHANFYHRGDRVYIKSQIPEVHDSLCKDADYEVDKDPIDTLNEVIIFLRRRSGK